MIKITLLLALMELRSNIENIHVIYLDALIILVRVWVIMELARGHLIVRQGSIVIQVCVETIRNYMSSVHINLNVVE